MSAHVVGKILIVLAVLAVIIYVPRGFRWAFMPQKRLPRNRVRYQRVRLALHLHPGKGHATVVQIAMHWSKWATFKTSKIIRPGLSAARRKNPYAHSVFMGRAHLGRKIWLRLQENVVIIAPPRTGKSGWLGTVVMHAPGPVVSASTRDDIFRLTSGIRGREGKIAVFNPQAIGEARSTFRWNPLAGCTDPATAIRRADALVYGASGEQKGGTDQQWWTAKASGAMRALLVAGALLEVSFADVADWIMTGEFSTAASALNQRGHAQFAATLRELSGPADKASASIRMFMSRCVTFMTDPVLAQAVTPCPGEEPWDIDSFLSGPNTLYLIGESQGDEAPLAPLYVALTSEIQFRAVQIGSKMEGARLDAPLLLALDEVAQTTPVPLGKWMADGSGKGIPCIVVVHGVAQLASRYGENGARTILDTAGCWVMLGGISDPDTLSMAEKLGGDIAIAERGADNHARHPVLSADQIRELPAKHAVILARNLAPVITHLPMAWDDKAYKRAVKAGTDVADLDAEAAEHFEIPDSWIEEAAGD
jgi:type IV secretory pathway TraG/TraD family ATPase VirD4